MLEKVKDPEKIREPGAEELENKPSANGEPNEQESQQTEKNEPARPKKPVGPRARHYMKRPHLAWHHRAGVRTQVASAVLAERLPAMWGKITAAIEVSSTSMKVGRMTATAISQGLQSGHQSSRETVVG